MRSLLNDVSLSELQELRAEGLSNREIAEKLGVARLASRIDELRKNGVAITTNRETGENRWGEPTTYARYWLVR